LCLKYWNTELCFFNFNYVYFKKYIYFISFFYIFQSFNIKSLVELKKLAIFYVFVFVLLKLIFLNAHTYVAGFYLMENIFMNILLRLWTIQFLRSSKSKKKLENISSKGLSVNHFLNKINWNQNKIQVREFTSGFGAWLGFKFLHCFILKSSNCSVNMVVFILCLV
jgi:hypothetical protein